MSKEFIAYLAEKYRTAHLAVNENLEALLQFNLTSAWDWYGLVVP